MKVCHLRRLVGNIAGDSKSMFSLDVLRHYNGPRSARTTIANKVGLETDTCRVKIYDLLTPTAEYSCIAKANESWVTYYTYTNDNPVPYHRIGQLKCIVGGASLSLGTFCAIHT
jgi:hypothetical protein